MSDIIKQGELEDSSYLIRKDCRAMHIFLRFSCV